MKQTLGSLMESLNSSRKEQDDSGGATIFGASLYTLGQDKLRMNDNVYDLTPENHMNLASNGYTGKKEKNIAFF